MQKRSSTSASTDSTDFLIPQQGDYVRYSRSFLDGIGVGLEIRTGYVTDILDEKAIVQNNDGIVTVDVGRCEVLARQHPLF